VAIHERRPGGNQCDQARVLLFASSFIDGIDMTVKDDGLDDLGSIGLENLMQRADRDGRDNPLKTVLAFTHWTCLPGDLVPGLDVLVLGNIRHRMESRKPVLDDELPRLGYIGQFESLREPFRVVTAFEYEREVLDHSAGLAVCECGLKRFDL